MYPNWLTKIIICILLIGLIAGCSEKSTQAIITSTVPTPTKISKPPTYTLPPPTHALIPPTSTIKPPTFTPLSLTHTLPPPTNMPSPTLAGFVNQLIYDIPEMYSVTIQSVEYPEISSFQIPGTEPDTLPMNIFYPPNWQVGELLPVVILPNDLDLDLKSSWRGQDRGMLSNFESWGREIAANGLLAITYETKNPNDLEAVVKYIQENGTDLGIDGTRMGLFGASVNGWLLGSFSNQENREYIKFAVYFYAYTELADSPYYHVAVDWCLDGGCFFSELPKVTNLRADLPIFVVNVAKNNYLQLAMSYFVQKAKEQGVPITYVNFDEGAQYFDFKYNISEYETKGIEIIQQALDFMKKYAFAP